MASELRTSWTVYRSARGNRGDSHAALSSDPTHTLCGYPMPEAFVPDPTERLPTCKSCRSRVRDLEQEARHALKPGETWNAPISRLYPPVVEKIDPDAPWNLGEFNVVEGDSLHTKIWGRVFDEALKYNPEPTCARRDYENALGSIVKVTVIQEGYLVELPRFAFNCLAPLAAEFSKWTHAASGGRARNVYFSRRGTSQVTEPLPEAAAPREIAPAEAAGLIIHPDLTDANYGNLMSLVQSETWAMVRAGVGRKEAYGRALDKVAAALVPPVSSATFRAFMSPGRRFQATKNGKDEFKVTTEEMVVKTAREEAEEEPTKAAKPLDLYRDWCQHNPYIPSDKALAHFGNFSASAWSWARNKLANEEGYTFSRGPYYGWLVERPLSPEEQRLHELQGQMDSIQAEIKALLGQIGQKKGGGGDGDVSGVQG